MAVPQVCECCSWHMPALKFIATWTDGKLQWMNQLSFHRHVATTHGWYQMQDVLSNMGQWPAPMACAATIQCDLPSVHGTLRGLLVPFYQLNSTTHGLF
jgi:hypothetical protein